jgi:hypothetical protein
MGTAEPDRLECCECVNPLANKLAGLGIHETERNIANKISRGGFTAAFFVQCLIAVGCHTLRLEE